MAYTNKDGSPNAGAFIKLGLVAIVLFFIVVPILFHTFSWVKVEGNQAIVRQDLFKGVMNDVWTSGTKLYCGWTTDIHPYNIGTQKCTFASKNPKSKLYNIEAEYPEIEVNCGENGGQKVYIAISMNYRVGWDTDKNGAPILSPTKLIKLHMEGIGKTYETVVINRTIIDTVNTLARPKEALTIYSGQGFVDFKDKIETELQKSPILRDRGIYVENVIVYGVGLDPEYEKEIEAKQLAVQTTLRKQQETKAAEEEARRIFAESQSTVEKQKQDSEAAKIMQIKQAEADKQKIILNAEADNEKEILQARAKKQKQTLEAEGLRDANLALASGILAKGQAEATVEQLKKDAMYSGEAGARRAQVEIATATAERLAGVLKGVSIIPERTILSTGRAVPGLVVESNDSK